ncbi:MAG: type IX secretion system protein PorQ [Bacteroidota bacterium]
MRIKYSFIFILAVCLSFAALSQNGGNGVYHFLDLASSPRIAAMGGNFLAIDDNDVSLALSNPSLLNPKMNNTLALNFVDYYTDVSYGSVMYANTLKKYGSFMASMQYVSYGQFQRTDDGGNVIGTFSAGDYAFNLGWGRRLDSNFSIGANLKGIYSHYDDNISYGIAVDVAGSYTDPKHNLCVSLLAANIGRQLKPYDGGNVEPIPFSMSLAVSKKLKHLPFRYSIIYTHLEKWNQGYTDPATTGNVDPITNQPIKKSGLDGFGDDLMRHIIIGGEFSPAKALSLRLGYNYQRRQELAVDTRMKTVGFSWGIGIRISRFQFNYSRSAFHLAGSPNYLSLVAQL